MPTFGELLDKLTKQASNRDAGTSVEKCPKKRKPAIFVLVMRSDNGEALSGLEIKISGAAADKKTTDKDGIAKFDPCKPGNYSANVVLSDAQKKKYHTPAAQALTASAASTSTAVLLLEPLASLEVKVIGSDDKKPLEGLAITAGTAPAVNSDKQGLASFTAIRGGAYTVRVTLPPALRDKWLTPKPLVVDVPPGSTTKAQLEVAPNKLCSLRLMLWDKNSKPLPDAQWTLLTPSMSSGATPPNGLIEVGGLPPGPGAVQLKITYPAPTPSTAAPTPPPASPSSPPPYPPPIQPADFKEPPPAGPAAPAEPANECTWTIRCDLLETFDSDPGLKSRLRNLGFDCEPSADSARTTRAVKAYQKLYLQQDAGSGQLADIKADLIKRHDTL